MIQKYSIFRCSNCGHFLYAPIPQKTRMCPFCNRVIKIDHLHSQITTDLEKTIERVKYYNAGENLEDFLEAKKNTPDQIQELMLKGRYIQQPTSESKEQLGLKRSITKLKQILTTHFTHNPRELVELEELCQRYKLDFNWVRDILTALAKDGYITFPTPWSIKYLGSLADSETSDQQNISSLKPTAQSTSRSKDRDKNIYAFIIQKIQQASEGITRKEIIDAIQTQGYPIGLVDEILNRLLQEGQIFEPKTGVLKWIS